MIMSYILSNDNRFYVALEPSYGVAAQITAGNRIPAVKLTTKQQNEKVQRADKTGSRTFAGIPSGIRIDTSFGLKTYMSNWGNMTSLPPHGPLFQACLGGSPAQSAGGTISTASGSTLAFSAPHGLTPGSAVTSGGEMRFVTVVVDAYTIQTNAAFSAAPAASSQTGPTALYPLSENLPSITLYDYWSPTTAVQRILGGMAVDTLSIKVNGDFHEFDFSGQAQDLVDTTSFTDGQFGLSAFPAEPSVAPINYSIIPGNLGEVWMGSAPTEFFTITGATVTFSNNLDLRAREFGAILPLAIAPGQRSVSIDFSLYQMDNTATAALYQAARQKSPISMMMQLGQQQGELFGIYMQSVVPTIPAFDDSDKRQQWQFQSCRAQGSVNDEIYVAFG
jgi:hypothetical protein